MDKGFAEGWVFVQHSPNTPPNTPPRTYLEGVVKQKETQAGVG